MSIDELKNISIGRKELAELLGYSENHINYLVQKEGAPKNKEHNSYSLFHFIQWHKEYLIKNKKEEIEKIRSEKPQDDLIRKKAEREGLELAKLKKEYIETKLVDATWQNSMQIIVTHIDGFYLVASPVLYGITDQKIFNNKFEELIKNLRTKIAETGLHILSKSTGTE